MLAEESIRDEQRDEQPARRPVTLLWVVKRVGFYLLLALGGLAVMAGALFVNVRYGFYIPARWVGLILYTTLIFWVVVRYCRPQWQMPKFWVSVTGCLVTHLLFFDWVLTVYPDWRVIWFMPIAIVEGGMIGALVAFVCKSA